MWLVRLGTKKALKRDLQQQKRRLKHHQERLLTPARKVDQLKKSVTNLTKKLDAQKAKTAEVKHQVADLTEQLNEVHPVWIESMSADRPRSQKYPVELILMSLLLMGNGVKASRVNQNIRTVMRGLGLSDANS